MWGHGQFHVRLQLIQNIEGIKRNGSCCDGVRSTDPGSSPCTPNNCDTYFRVCLQHHQTKVQIDGKCTLGEAYTPVLGGDSFTIPESNGTSIPGFQNPISIHFGISWLVSLFYFLFWFVFNRCLFTPEHGVFPPLVLLVKDTECHTRRARAANCYWLDKYFPRRCLA